MFFKGFVKGIMLTAIWLIRIFCTPVTVVGGFAVLLFIFLPFGVLSYIWDWCNNDEDLEFPFVMTFEFPVFLMLTGTFSYKTVDRWINYCIKREGF